MKLSFQHQIRGSVLLVSGRGFSLLLNLMTQVLCVRYLTKSDYGSFAYAIAIIELLALLSSLGYDKSLPRFAAIYDEKKDSRRLVGLILTSFSLVVMFGVGIVLVGTGTADMWSEWIKANPLSVQLITILIVLAPVYAIDSLMLCLFGVFSGAWHVFLRRYIVRPVLRLAAVLFVIGIEGDATTLAIAYVFVGILGVILFIGALIRVMRNSEIIQSWNQKIVFPLSETVKYNLPILSSDLVYICRGTLIIIILGYFHAVEKVAEFQAVLPLGRLIEVVLLNFMILFIPAISRAFASDDRDNLLLTFGKTQAWVTLLSFPLFAIGFGGADILVPGLFGSQYASSSDVLAWLAVGFYIRVVFGLAARTLKVLGHLRVVIYIDVITLIMALLVSLWLIPQYGAVGAAMSAGLTSIFHSVSNQAALYYFEKIGLWDKVTAKLYIFTGLAVMALVILRWLIVVDTNILVAMSAIIGLGLPLYFSAHLELRNNFPEMMNFIKKLRAKD